MAPRAWRRCRSARPSPRQSAAEDRAEAMAARYTPDVRRALLAKHFLLREADPKTLDQLVASSVVVSYGNRQRIFDKGDDGDRLLGVLAGQVRIYVMSSEGRELI